MLQAVMTWKRSDKAMINIVLVVIIGSIVGFSIGYIVKEKKKGVKCIGCPDAGICGGNCGGGKEAD